MTGLNGLRRRHLAGPIIRGAAGIQGAHRGEPLARGRAESTRNEPTDVSPGAGESPRGVPTPGWKILVPLGESGDAARVLPWVEELARGLGAAVTLLHVREDGADPGQALPRPLHTTFDRAMHRLQSLARVEREVLSGSAAEKIAERLPRKVLLI